MNACELSPLDLFPLEIWRTIAMKNVSAWRSVCLVVPGVFNEKDNKKMKYFDLTLCRSVAGGISHYTWRMGSMAHTEEGEGPTKYNDRGEKSWYYYGKMHRSSLEGPARIDAQYHTVWYYWEGMRHRDPKEGPAVISPTMNEYYWKNQLHRDHEDGPALVLPNIHCYYKNGDLHRPVSVGPAIVYLKRNRTGDYYMNGTPIQFDDAYYLYESLSTLF